jgi:Xaa-Pro dipeptidase
MALHFSREELAERRANTIALMQKRGLDGLLIFRQESMYYLTGYDTFGYVFFQCLYLGADGRLMLLTRAPDLLQAQHTSVIDDIRIWVDGPEAQPAVELHEILRGFGCAGRRLGVEYEAYGLTGRNALRLNAALDGVCKLEDASDLVSRLRVVKSAAELAYVRKAAELADLALDEAHRLAGPDAFEGDIIAAMQGAVFRGGGDDPANEYIIGSGPDALLCRYFSGRRRLDSRDQLTLEFAGAYRHYHACLMRTIPIGEPLPGQREMHKVSVEALDACKEALRPGRAIGEVFDAYARVYDRPPRPPAQRHRIQPRHDLRAELDGLADVLPRQPGAGGAGHGLLHPHHPVRRRARRRHDQRPHRAGHRPRLRSAVAAFDGAGGEVGRIRRAPAPRPARCGASGRGKAPGRTGRSPASPRGRRGPR